MYGRYDCRICPFPLCSLRPGRSVCGRDQLSGVIASYGTGIVWHGSLPLLCCCDSSVFHTVGILWAVQQPEIYLLKNQNRIHQPKITLNGYRRSAALAYRKARQRKRSNCESCLAFRLCWLISAFGNSEDKPLPAPRFHAREVFFCSEDTARKE